MTSARAVPVPASVIPAASPIAASAPASLSLIASPIASPDDTVPASGERVTE